MSTTTPATHTPGPWHVSAIDPRTIGPMRVIGTGDANIPQLQAVARVTARSWETEPNARLIAAAPDLLAALKHLMRYDFGDSQGANEARAAIAKAEGRS